MRKVPADNFSRWRLTAGKSCVLGLFLISTCGFLFIGCRKNQDDQIARQTQAGNIIIIDTRTDQTDRTRAKQNVEDTLIRYPDIDGLVGLWSYNGPAILSAVKDAGKLGRVKIICFDEEQDVLQGVTDGHIYATVVQQPYEFGYQSIRILAALARDDRTVLPSDGILEVPVKIINQDNIHWFRDNLQALLADTPAEQNQSTGENSPDKVEVAYLTNNASDFWKIARAGVRNAEKEYNVNCQFLMPPTGTAEEQQRLIESLLARGVSGVAISPIDPANQKEMINQACQQMNVITQDSDAADSERLCYVGTNNYKAGRQAGKLIRQVLPAGGKIMLFVGSLDAQNAIDRRRGIVDELSEKPAP